MKSYIHKIFVHHNFVEKQFEIDISQENKVEYKNLILTGKNGSGKTTLLKAINKELFLYKTGIIPSNPYYNLMVNNTKQKSIKEVSKIEFENPKVEIQFGKETDFLRKDLLVIYIPTSRLYEFGAADRKVKMNLNQALNNQNKRIDQLKSNNLKIADLQRAILKIENQVSNHQLKAVKLKSDLQKKNDHNEKSSISLINRQLLAENSQIAQKTKNIELQKKKLDNLINLDSDLNPFTILSPQLLQYLIEIKEKQAFAIADEEDEIIKTTTGFFKNLENLFQLLYEDNKLKLKHSFKNNKFFFKFGNGVEASFNEIADGFKSVLVIVAEIFLQMEAFRELNGVESDLSGIVLIDEIEAHLHLSIQEKILPSLTSFFPNLQFIISTHSPQVCASDRNSYCYNITSKYLEKEYMGGISYDVIAKAHFGLASEYSIYTTELISRIKNIMSKKTISPNEQNLLEELSKELNNISPELTYELDLFLNKIDKRND